MARSVSLLKAVLRPDSEASLPDLWKDALLRELGPSRKVLGYTTKDAQGWLIHGSPEATLTVGISHPANQPVARLLRRMQHAREQLAARQGQPTTLTLRQRERLEYDVAWWEVVLSALSHQVSPNLTLSLQFQHLQPRMLSFCGEALPGLTALSISSCSFPADSPYGSEYDNHYCVHLPSPSAFPSLRTLTVGSFPEDVQGRLWRGVGPYLAQLTSLTIAAQEDEHEGADHSDPDDRPSWSDCLRNEAASQTLTTLSLPIELHPWLAEILIESAPALVTLEVTGVGVITDPEELDDVIDKVGLVCSWRTLRLVKQDRFQAAALDWLPLPRDEGKLVIEGPELTCVELTLPVSDRVANSLARVDICNYKEVRLVAEDDHPHTELNALRSATPVIHTLYSSHVELVLSYFTMTESLAAELRALAARGWGHMSLTGLEWPSDTALTTRLPPLQTLGLGSRLTDARLGLMQACVSSAKALKVSGVASLSTAIEAGVRLPWESIRLDSCPVGELVGAAPLVGEAAWDVGTLDIVLTKEQVHSGEAAAFTEQLRRVRFTKVDTLRVAVNDSASVAEQPRLLQASLGIASALPCAPGCVHLRGWTSTVQVVSQFRHLPVWGQRTPPLKLSLTTYERGPSAWTVSPWPLTHLGTVMPTSYPERIIEANDLSSPELESLLFAVPGNRTSDTPLTVRVNAYNDELVSLYEDMREYLDLSGMYSHVTWK